MRDEDYLSHMQALLHDPAGIDAAGEEVGDHQGLALAFYTRSARGRRMTFAKNAFPELLRILSEDRRKVLVDRYIAAPSGDNLDWSFNAEQITSVIDALVEEGTLPKVAASFVRHEWALFEAGQKRDELRVGSLSVALMVNPTLDVLEHSIDPTSEVAKKVLREPSDETPPEAPALIGYFQHPLTARGRWTRLEPSVLAAMRIVDENIDHERAATEAGVTLEDVRQCVEALCEQGLFVAAGA